MIETAASFEPLHSISINSGRKVPEHIQKHIEKEHRPELADLFSEQEVARLDLDKFAQRIKEHGSGHFAIHRGKLSYLDMYLRHGTIVPTKLAHEYTKAGKYEERVSDSNERFVSSRSLHFSIDELYTGRFQKGVALVCPVETIMENKSFQGIPLYQVNHDKTSSAEAVKNDMPVSGLSADPTDDSHKFNIDGLGILLVPASARAVAKAQPSRYLDEGENWNEEETPSISVEEHVQQLNALGLPCPKKIFFYQGSLQDGIKQLFEQYDLRVATQDKKITTSGPVKFKYSVGDKGTGSGHYDTGGEGDFYSVK